MKNAILIILIFVSCKSSNIDSKQRIDNNNAIGLGILKYGNHSTLKIYRSEKLLEFDEISRRSGGPYEFSSVNFKEKLNPNNIMEPFENGPPAYIQFRVLKITKLFYKVYINIETKEIGYIKTEDVLNYIAFYEDWESILKKAHYINVGNADIYDNDKKIIIDYISKSCDFDVLEIYNEWIKIKPTSKRSTNDSNCSIKIGWIKWHNNEELLIRIVKGVWM